MQFLLKVMHAEVTYNITAADLVSYKDWTPTILQTVTTLQDENWFAFIWKAKFCKDIFNFRFLSLQQYIQHHKAQAQGLMLYNL